MPKKPDYKTLELPANYKPSKKEEYMSPEQLAYFYKILIGERAEILGETDEVLDGVRTYQSDGTGAGDIIDNAQNETQILSEIRFRERDTKLLKIIDAALDRMEKGTYGYCVITGEKIGLDRLLARPMATMTVEAQEDYELKRAQRANASRS